MLAGVPEMKLFDLRVTVERIEGRSVCGLAVGDYFELTESSRVRIPAGSHFASTRSRASCPCSRRSSDGCRTRGLARARLARLLPDPDERVVMRIERIGERTMRSEELT